ncbi:MAG: exosortase/archaeosortase family protein [Fimbriimonadales bacterium]|nr:exosortase/archaeosortase family protein [Fimbriimonadales bacterium]
MEGETIVARYRASKPSLGPLSVALVALFFLLAFWGLFGEFWSRWTMEHSPFGYGYLVPPTVAYLVWRRWRVARVEPVESGRWYGWTGIAAAVLLHLVGVLSAVTTLQSAAFLALVLLVPYVLWGGRVFRHLWAPLAYSATMIPWPDQLTSRLLLPSQEVSTRLAVALLDFAGVHSYVQGTNVYTPNYHFEVARACSGLTILFPVAAIAILNAMMADAARWKKALLVASALPLSVLANSFRIALVGWIGDHGGAPLADRLHDASGWVGVLLAIVLLTLVQVRLGMLQYLPEYLPGGEAAKEARA